MPMPTIPDPPSLSGLSNDDALEVAAKALDYAQAVVSQAGGAVWWREGEGVRVPMVVRAAVSGSLGNTAGHFRNLKTPPELPENQIAPEVAA